MASLYTHEVTTLSIHPLSKSFGFPCGCAFDCEDATTRSPDYRCCCNCDYNATIDSGSERRWTSLKDRRPRSAVPKELDGIYSDAQWLELVRQLDSAVAPIMTACCAIPWLVCLVPLFCFATCCHCDCFQQDEKRAIERILAAQNARLEPEGMSWNLQSIKRPEPAQNVNDNCFAASESINLALKFDLVAREQFEAAHSSARKLAGAQRAQKQQAADALAAKVATADAAANASRRTAQLAAEAESAKLTLAFLRAMELRDAAARAAAAPMQGQQLPGQSTRFGSLGPPPSAEAMPPPPPNDGGSSAFSSVNAPSPSSLPQRALELDRDD